MIITMIKKHLVKKMVEINKYDVSYQKKEKDQFVMLSYVTGPRPRREPFSSM